MSEQLNTVRPVMSRKKIFLLMAIGSFLMTAGFVWKSGLIGKAGDKVASWYEGVERIRETEKNVREAKERAEQARLAELQRLRSLPADSREAIQFRGGHKTLVLNLKADNWSRQVRAPKDRKVKLWLTMEPQNSAYHIWFEEDAEPMMVMNEPVKLGRKSGNFRILGTREGQVARITVEDAPLTVEDLKNRTPY